MPDDSPKDAQMDGDTLRGAIKKDVEEALVPPLLKNSFLWAKKQWRGVKEGRTLFLVTAFFIVGMVLLGVFRVYPVPGLKGQMEKVERERDTARQQLAPFWAAGDKYFSNVPTAERLMLLLTSVTNSSADIAELRRLQSRKAKLQVAVVREFGGWNNSSVINSNTVLFVPHKKGETNFGFHFTLQNLGELPAETIHMSVRSEIALAGGVGWEDQRFLTLENGHHQLLAKVDAVYPNSIYSLGAIRISADPKYRFHSLPTHISVFSKNAEPIFFPLEIFFFETESSYPPYVSTNRESWKTFK